MPASPAPATLPPLSLQVQYATAATALPRWRLRRWVERALREVWDTTPGADLRTVQAVAFTLRLTDEPEMAELNTRYRQRAGATNVLTFEYGTDATGCLQADIIVCLPVLVREAREQGKPLRDHAAHLVTHGVLHALGYDHVQEAEAICMERLETRILAKQGFPDPYRPVPVD